MAKDGGAQEKAHVARIAYLRDLVAALGIDADAYLALQGKPMGAAIAAGDAFDGARRKSRQLDAELEVRDERARTALDSQYKVLMSHLKPDDALHRNALELAHREIEANWRAIMLLPAGPYELLLQELLDTLEPQSGDGLLPPEGEDLLRRVKHLYRALGRSHRGSLEEWEDLVASLGEGPATRGPRLEPGNGKRLN
jgi:hypothetical protein